MLDYLFATEQCDITVNIAQKHSHVHMYRIAGFFCETQFLQGINFSAQQ